MASPYPPLLLLHNIPQVLCNDSGNCGKTAHETRMGSEQRHKLLYSGSVRATQ